MFTDLRPSSPITKQPSPRESDCSEEDHTYHQIRQPSTKCCCCLRNATCSKWFHCGIFYTDTEVKPYELNPDLSPHVFEW